jgi:hypothetical protein
MTPEQRHKFVEIERMKFFRSLYVAWTKELRQPAIDLIQKLKENPYIIDNIKLYNNGCEETFIKSWQVSGVKFANLTYNEYHKDQSFQYRVKANNVMDDYWLNYMKQYSLTEAGQRITWINQTTDEELMKIIRMSLDASQEQGLGVIDIANNLIKDIRKDYGELSKYRAQRIARTEIIGASNRGQLLGAQSLGYNMRKVWLSTLDVATRTGVYDHRRCHGETRAIYDVFTMSGEALQHPGDPKGSAGNTISCFLPDQLSYTKITDIKRVYKSLYIGQIITIKTKSGYNFTCTPNHPILTTIGWVNAKDIDQTHNIIKSHFINSHFSDFNVNNKPATFEQIYNSLSKIGMIMRVSGIDVNFYGDIPNGDVNIISVKWSLLNRIKSFTFNKIKNVNFKTSNFRKIFPFSNSLFNTDLFMKFFRQIPHNFISFFCYLFFLFIGSIFKTYKICITPISYIFPGFFKATNKGNSNYIIFFGERKKTLSLPVFLYNFIKRHNNWFVKLFNINFCISERLANSLLTDMQEFTNMINRFAGQIEIDNVISNDLHDYEGYVYTFETKTQMYNINSFIAKNCRCTQGFEVI